MNSAAFDVLVVVLGLVLVVFPKVVAREIVREQNWLYRSNFGEREVKVGASVLFLGGIFCVAIGILRLISIG
jgi:hypothetical protein